MLKRNFFTKQLSSKKIIGEMKYFSKIMNFKHVHSYECPECHETREIVFDEFHDEVICLSCGLVLNNNDREIFVK